MVWNKENKISVNQEYYSSIGKKFRNKGSVPWNKEAIDLSTAEQLTKNSESSSINRRTKPLLSCRVTCDDVSVIPPIRQTASIFKQPVTIIRNLEEVQVRQDLRHGIQEKPRQLFWEKRLQQLRACDLSGEELQLSLAHPQLQPVGPDIHEETALRSLAAALHLASHPITGQIVGKESIDQDPGTYLDPQQPLLAAAFVSDEDIRSQEARVEAARRRLQDEVNNEN